jgi:D-alanine-D-alanine ligase
MENVQKLIGVLAGGYSSERGISLASGKTAYDAFVEAGYTTIFIELDREGFKVDGALVKISDLGLSYVFNVIHGTPGEDGHISGMLEVFGIPHSTCDTFTSALTFSKFQCNTLLRDKGIVVPRGMSLLEMPEKSIFNDWNFPLFVKPNRSGSSFGVSRITSITEFAKAFKEAQKECQEVIVEEGVSGVEVGCGVLRSVYDFGGGVQLDTPKTQAIAITEIVPTESDFFDYEAKYDGKSQEITPARISPEMDALIQEISMRTYDVLGLKGIVRMDFIIDEKKGPVLIEVNSIPGLSPASIVPQQVAHRGWKLSEVLSRLAEEQIA